MAGDCPRMEAVMPDNFAIIVLRLNDGTVQPLAWAERRLSVKQLRKACRKFRHDPDVVRPESMYWARLYRSPADMKRELPKY
jgi:hypothetical protein